MIAVKRFASRVRGVGQLRLLLPAQRAIRRDPGAKGHRVARQEDPHSELAGIAGERRFQLIVESFA